MLGGTPPIKNFVIAELDSFSLAVLLPDDEID